MNNADYGMMRHQSVYCGVPVRRWAPLGWFAYTEVGADGERTQRVSTW